MRLPVRRILVLTHNFSVWKPVAIWLYVKKDSGVWLH